VVVAAQLPAVSDCDDLFYNSASKERLYARGGTETSLFSSSKALISIGFSSRSLPGRLRGQACFRPNLTVCMFSEAGRFESCCYLSVQRPALGLVASTARRASRILNPDLPLEQERCDSPGKADPWQSASNQHPIRAANASAILRARRSAIIETNTFRQGKCQVSILGNSSFEATCHPRKRRMDVGIFVWRLPRNGSNRAHSCTSRFLLIDVSD